METKKKKPRGAAKPSPLARVVKEALEEFKPYPHVRGRTLARILFDRNPFLFKSIEHARDSIKYYTKRKKDKKYFQEHKNTNPYEIPLGVDYNQTEPYKVPAKYDRVLIVCDLHSPFHEEWALALAFDFAIKNNANCIFINGDLFDHHALSRFPEDPRKRNPAFEFSINLELLEAFRRAFPDIKIYFKLGNHEIWWEKYLWHNAPQITGAKKFKFEEVYELDRLNIEMIRDKVPMHFGKITGIHGHEMRGGGGVNIARGLFLKYVDNIFCGHFHRTSHHSEPRGRGDVIGTWSIGCLAKLKPEYMNINKWSLRCASLQWTPKEFEFHNFKIINGKIKGE